MNKITKTIFLMVLLISLGVSLFPTTTFAASASASVSSSTVKPGDTVTVTARFNGSNIGAVYGSFSYDASVLQYISGSGASGGGGAGTIALVANSANASSLSTSITFKALKAGSATISFSANEIYSFEEESLGSANTSTKVAVKAPAPSNPAPSKPKPDSNSNKDTGSNKTPTKPDTSKEEKKPEKAPEKEPEKTPPNPVEEALEITLGEQSLYLWRDLSTVKLPEGFTSGETSYQSEKIKVAKHKEKDINLVYLTDKEGKKGSFYVVDQSDQLYPYINFSTTATYTILQLEDTTKLPEGYKETTLELNDQTVQAWTQEAGENLDFYLLYGMNAEGEKNFYLYHQAEETMQRFTDRTVVVEKEPVPQSFFQKLSNDPMLITVVVGLGALSIILIIILIFLLVNPKKRGKH